MKITRERPYTRPLVSLTSFTGGAGSAPSGHVPTSIGSNGDVAWGSNVSHIYANGSNHVLGPLVNFASGTGITLSVSSNTMTITGTGGGSSGVTVADEGTPLSTAGTTLDFVGAGVTASGSGATKTITIPGGSGGGDFTFIDEDVVTGSVAATMDVTGIPNTYRDLVIVILGRCDNGSIQGVNLRVGDGSIDTGSNYRYQRNSIGTGDVSTHSSSATSVSAGMVTESGATAGNFTPTTIEIMAYADSTIWRHMQTRSTYHTSDRYINWGSGAWMNTADEIERVRVTPTAGNWAIGSRMTVYGRG